MKNVQISLSAQILYMLGMGIGLLFFPDLVLSVFGITTTTEVWIRILGALVLVLVSYYYAMQKQQNVTFFWATVWGRYGFSLALAALVLLGYGEKPLYLFAILETLLAAWTHFALLKLKAQ